MRRITIYDDQLSQGPHGVCLFYSITPFVYCNQVFGESSDGAGTSGGGGGTLAIWFGYSVHFPILFPPTFLSKSRFSHISLRSFFVIFLTLPVTSKIHWRLVLYVFQRSWITDLCIRYLCFKAVMSARILHSLGMFLQRKWFGIPAKR
jgi:hypothetical protein